MSPLDWIRKNLLITALIASAVAVLAIIGFIYWFADKIGDSRELDVTRRIQKQEDRAHEAANEGRDRARACHALGPDRLWDAAAERCGWLPGVPRPRG